MFKTYCKNKGYLLKSWVRNKREVWGRKNVKVKRKRKRKKRMKYESSFEFMKKEKDVTKLFRMKERPTMNFWPMFYVFCKEF